MRLFNSSIHMHVSDSDLDAWCEVTDLLNYTNDFLNSHPNYKGIGFFRCHSLCDAIVFNLDKSDLKVIDGIYLGLRKDSPEDNSNYLVERCRHSWLVTPNQTIIDPYPVGMLSINPQIIPAKGEYTQFGYNQYVPDHSIGKIVRNRDLFEESKRWKRIMRKAKQVIISK